MIRWAPQISQPQLSSNDQSISALVVFKDGLTRVLAFRIRVGVSYTHSFFPAHNLQPRLSTSLPTPSFLGWILEERATIQLRGMYACMCLSPHCKEGDGGAHTDIVMTLENLLRENQNPYASEELKQTVELSSLSLAK